MKQKYRLPAGRHSFSRLIKYSIPGISLLFITGVLIVSCTEFFSTTLAPWAARDPNKLIPAVNAGNVDDLIARYGNNPDVSLTILKKIQSAVNGGASDADTKKLQSAALEAAVNAAGLLQAATGAVNQAGNIDFSNPEEARNFILDGVGNLKNLDAVSSALNEILPKPDSSSPPYSDEFNAWAAGASADDLAMAAAVLIAGEIKGKNTVEIDTYLFSLYDNTGQPDPPAGSDTANLALAMAIASTLDGRVDQLSGPYKNILQGLNLIPS